VNRKPGKIAIFRPVSLIAALVLLPITTASAASSYVPFTVGSTQYWGKTASGVTFALTRVRVMPAITTPLGTFQAQGEYVVIAVAVENGRRSAVTLTEGQFRLVGPGNVRYSSSSKSIYLRDPIGLTTFNPGVGRMVRLAFDMPAGISVRSLSLAVQGGFFGGYALLPLHPIQGRSPPS
jgi:hypothetical protein